jgi:hypothetical protein
MVDWLALWAWSRPLCLVAGTTIGMWLEADRAGDRPGVSVAEPARLFRGDAVDAAPTG